MIKQLRLLCAEWLLSLAFSVCPDGQFKFDFATFLLDKLKPDIMDDYYGKEKR